MKLEMSINTALLLLVAAGAQDHVIGPSEDGVPDEAAVWVGVGLGYCTAKGWAVYRGDGEFKITEQGVKAAEERLNEAGLLKN